jgi:hypothetical protein
MDVTTRIKLDLHSKEPQVQRPPVVPGWQSSALAQNAQPARATSSYVGEAAELGNLHAEVRLHLEHALMLDPAAVRPRVLLFALELQDQRYAPAEQIIATLVREHPAEPDYLVMFADLKLRTTDLRQSQKLTSQALTIDPEHVDARRMKLILDTVSGERPATDVALARLLERNPSDQQVLFALFQTFIERNRLNEAVRLGQQLSRAEPHNGALRDRLLELQMFTHPFALPVRALRRAGWFGSGVLALLAIAFYKLLTVVSEGLATGFLVICLTTVVYILVYQPLMRFWLAQKT